jgi:Arc/MetJ-type ribon-helix-helix transcriptional regulator
MTRKPRVVTFRLDQATWDRMRKVAPYTKYGSTSSFIREGIDLMLRQEDEQPTGWSAHRRSSAAAWIAIGRRSLGDVRFATETGRIADIAEGPSCANSRHSADDFALGGAAVSGFCGYPISGKP